MNLNKYFERYARKHISVLRKGGEEALSTLYSAWMDEYEPDLQCTPREFLRLQSVDTLAKMLEQEMETMGEEEKASFQAELEEGRARDKAAAEERARKAAEKEARKNRKQQDEDITPENLEDIQDETLRNALKEAREQADKEEEQSK